MKPLQWTRAKGGSYVSIGAGNNYVLKWTRDDGRRKIWDVDYGGKRVNFVSFATLPEAKIRAELHRKALTCAGS